MENNLKIGDRVKGIISPNMAGKLYTVTKLYKNSRSLVEVKDADGNKMKTRFFYLESIEG